jgi:hypothetical protein
MTDNILTVEDVLLLRDWFVKNELGIDYYPYQVEVSNAIIKAVLGRTGDEIPIEISRQAGKTESVVCTVCFLMTFSLALTKRFWGYEHGLRFVIWAPQREQAKTDFDRLKAYFKKLSRQKSGKWANIVDNQESNQVTLQIRNGSFCYIFPLTPTSNPESKTADVQIFEEAHKIIDFEKKNKAEPMGASTNAPEISIGVSWYNKNYFKRLIDTWENKHTRIPADMVIAQRRKRFEETGDVRHLLYEKKFNKIVERDGRDDPAIRTQWLLEWVLEAGMFMVPSDWEAMTEPYAAYKGGQKYYAQAKLLDEDRRNDCFAGIDTAKSPDSTVVTIVRWNEETKWKELVALLELKGENYADQFTIISGFDTVLGKSTGKGMFDYFNIVGVAIDSTGQGSFMPDMFARHTRFRDERSGLFPVKFSLQSKDTMYTNLQQVVQNRLTAIPADDTLELTRMRKQLLDLEKEYKGSFLTCHHPNDEQGQEYHDDYPDAWALAEYAFAMQQRIAKPKIRTL